MQNESKEKLAQKALELITAEELSSKKQYAQAAEIYLKNGQLLDAHKEAAKAEKHIYAWSWTIWNQDRYDKAIAAYKLLGLDHKARELENQKQRHMERTLDWL